VPWPRSTQRYQCANVAGFFRYLIGSGFDGLAVDTDDSLADARVRHPPVHRGLQARLPPEPLPFDESPAGALAGAYRGAPPLAANYLERLSAAPPRAKAIRQALILSGFVLDGQLSSRELRRLDAMRELGVLPDRRLDLRRRLRRFLKGGGLPLDELPTCLRGPVAGEA
jgi:hypothetical protein